MYILCTRDLKIKADKTKYPFQQITNNIQIFM